MRNLKLPRSLQFLGIGLVIFALLTVAVGIAGAQQPTPGEAPPQGQQGGPRGRFGQDFISQLAANLGLPVETVQSAIQQTFQQMHQNGNENGGQNGQGGPGFGRGGRFGHGRPFGQGQAFGPGAMMRPLGALLQGTANVLGMTPQDLRSELQQGKTLAQVAEEHGVSADSLADQLTTMAEQAMQNNQQQLHDRIRQALDHQFPMPPQRPAPGQSSGSTGAQS